MVGNMINSHKVARYIALTITDDSFVYSRKRDSIA